MELEDNEEEDCEVFIEDLRSEDPNLKINVVSKIVSISHILGPARVRDELLPSLISVIADQSNEDEFLIKLAMQIQLLSEENCVGGKEHEHLLIPPLELLSSMEEVSIRESAVSCITAISATQEPNFFTYTFMSMIRTLSQWDNQSSRVSASSLLGSCFAMLPESLHDDSIDIFIDLCKDETPMVRRTAAANLPNIAQKIKSEDVVATLIPVWQSLVRDSIDSVRVKAIEAAEKLVQRVAKAQVAELFLPVLKELLNLKNKTWRIRYAIAEVLTCILTHADKESTKREGILMYEQLLKDSEHEVRSISVTSLKSLGPLIPDSTLQSIILPTISTLSLDPSQHVRMSLGEVICTLGGRLDTKTLAGTIIPAISTLLKDETLEVRLSVMQHIVSLNADLGAENIQKFVLPLFAGIESDKQWRYRLAFIEYLPKLSMQLNAFDKTIAKLIDSFIFDHYSAVREQNFKNFGDFITLHSLPVVMPVIQSTLKSLVASTNYIFRLSAIQGITILSTKLPELELQYCFQDYATKLVGDPVVNVAIFLLKLYIDIRNCLNFDVRVKFVDRARRVIASNHGQDPDVAYYLSLI